MLRSMLQQITEAFLKKHEKPGIKTKKKSIILKPCTSTQRKLENE